MSEKNSWLEGKKILAVDDEEDVLEVIMEELEIAEVDVAKNFETATDKINQNHYDLVILDIMGVNGLKLLENAVEKKMPAVMLTAHALNYEILIKSIRKGSIGFLPKEKLAELARLLNILMATHVKGESTWQALFDEMGDFFNKSFGKPMGTVEWICRQIQTERMV
ncbi:MAG: response regulator [Deltaproteobacteria bacterium]|nr:response regulator [Candidatus Desulfobacula maris]